MKKAGITLGVSIVVVILLLQVATTPAVIRRLTFSPRPLPEDLRDPMRWRLDARQVRPVTADGLRLHGWWTPARSAGGETCAAIINLHGNAGNIAGRGYLADELSDRGYAVLLFDYRGYGASEGSPSEVGLYRDAEAALRFVREQEDFPAERIALVAHSLGTAVATELAARHAVGAVVLVAPFTSLPEAARAKLKIVPRWLFDWDEGSFDALEDMDAIDEPILMARGTEDGLVAREIARALYSAADDPKAWVEVLGAGHNDVFREPDFIDQMDRFIRNQVGC